MSRRRVYVGKPGQKGERALKTGGHVQVALVIRVQRGRIVQFEVIADPQRTAQLRIEEDPGPG